MNLFVSNNYIYAEYTNMQSYALLIIRENSNCSHREMLMSYKSIFMRLSCAPIVQHENPIISRRMTLNAVMLIIMCDILLST